MTGSYRATLLTGLTMTPGTISSARPRFTWRVALLLVAALFLGFFGASLLSSALSPHSSHAVTWDPAHGFGGSPGFDAAVAQTMTVVNVEVAWPGCVRAGDYSWLVPEVSYQPSSVTITLYTSTAFAKDPNCGADGHMRIVPASLLPQSFPVQLSEPLGRRPLFDGSQAPAAARPYR